MTDLGIKTQSSVHIACPCAGGAGFSVCLIYYAARQLIVWCFHSITLYRKNNLEAQAAADDNSQLQFSSGFGVRR